LIVLSSVYSVSVVQILINRIDSFREIKMTGLAAYCLVEFKPTKFDNGGLAVVTSHFGRHIKTETLILGR